MDYMSFTDNRFKFEDVDQFDRHIRLSIPSYEVLACIFKGFADHFAYKGGEVIDIGCSTGSFLHSLNKKEGCAYTGIDDTDIRAYTDFGFIKGNAVNELEHVHDVSVVVSMFFLQFLGMKERILIMEDLRRLVVEGAVLLIAEKIEIDDSKIQNLVHRMHVQEKRKHFTDTEILDKDEQLANCMSCKSEISLENELKHVGDITRVWQSFNFVGYVVR